MYYPRKIPVPFQNRTEQKIPDTIPIEAREKSTPVPSKPVDFSPLALLLLFDAFSPQKKDG